MVSSEMTYKDEAVIDFLEWLESNFQVVILPKISTTGGIPGTSILELYQARICGECDKPSNNHEDWCYR